MHWQENLLSLMASPHSEQQILEALERAGKSLGFDYFAYGLQHPLPISRPTILIRNNYPPEWQRRYLEAGYLHTDPTIAHCRKSQTACIWTDKVFAPAPRLWAEARSFGLNIGWSQSSRDTAGVRSMLSLVRTSGSLSPEELFQNELKMSWLVQIAHALMSRCLSAALVVQFESALTQREVEVLKWTADGKTSGEISDILSVSLNTVNFHVKNAIVKLGVLNKTAAVVTAAMLGLLA